MMSKNGCSSINDVYIHGGPTIRLDLPTDTAQPTASCKETGAQACRRIGKKFI